MEAEKTRARAKQQEAIAAKMKVENQAIRDEAEADLSESFAFSKKERTKTLHE